MTNYQFTDDVSITHGRHSFQFGGYFRRDDVTDYSPSIETTPLALATRTGTSQPETDWNNISSNFRYGTPNR